jgi:hypothetical protein
MMTEKTGGDFTKFSQSAYPRERLLQRNPKMNVKPESA